ncbi:MAG TPA: hypothetical protein EYP82_03485 [Hydrogenothermaceae bacterium]|nr:hypothetical protein [Hydrogenothermaceae bacterium]
MVDSLANKISYMKFWKFKPNISARAFPGSLNPPKPQVYKPKISSTALRDAMKLINKKPKFPYLG